MMYSIIITISKGAGKTKLPLPYVCIVPVTLYATEYGNLVFLDSTAIVSQSVEKFIGSSTGIIILFSNLQSLIF